MQKDANSLRGQKLRKLTLKMHNLHKFSKIKGFETLNAHFCLNGLYKNYKKTQTSVGGKREMT